MTALKTNSITMMIAPMAVMTVTAATMTKVTTVSAATAMAVTTVDQKTSFGINGEMWSI
jgi:hypothetical protein